MQEIAIIIGDTNLFFEKVLGNIEKAGIKFDNLGFKEIDHIGVRTESMDQYNEMKASLMSLTDLRGEIPIRGRNVSTFALNEPIVYKDYKISALELLAPTEDNKYKKGSEHIEVVVEKDLEAIAKMYPNLPFKLVRPESLNPELVLRFDDMTAVKFHSKSLLEVVKLEKEHGITEL